MSRLVTRLLKTNPRAQQRLRINLNRSRYAISQITNVMECLSLTMFLSEMLVYLRRKAPLQSLPRFIVSGFVRYVHLVPQPGLVFHFLPLFSRHASQKHLLLFSFLPLRPFSHLFSMAQFVQSDVGPAFLPSSRFLRLSLLSGVLLHLPFFVIVILLWK